jgi:hypothetical protein
MPLLHTIRATVMVVGLLFLFFFASNEMVVRPVLMMLLCE